MSEHAPSGFFALRTPLLPFDGLLTWSDGLCATSVNDDLGRLESALAADRARLRNSLRSIFTRAEVREALFVASPDLEARLDLWLRDPETDSGQKIERALVRYFSRMTGRATPFGLFAGCSVGTVGSETRLLLAERARYQRHTRLDMDYLVLLTEALGRDPALRATLTFAVNSSLHRGRGRFRYCEVRRNGQGWTHHQVALEATDYLDATLMRAWEGANIGTLAAGLQDVDPEAPLDESEEYITALIDNQVLVSELRPTVTGPEPIDDLTTRLRDRGANLVADQLEQVRQELENLDADGLGVEPSRYRQVARQLESLPGEIHLGRLFQVDLVKPVVSASLGSAVLAEIRRGVTLLHSLARRPREDRLAHFREAFVRRYEGREVALVEALDEETGIGLDGVIGGQTDAALLDGFTFPKVEEETVAWGRREVLLLDKLGTALAAGDDAIFLQPRDLEEMAETNPPPLPDAFAVLATVVAASETFARGDFQVLLGGVTGPSGARLLGRFCHADPELHAQVARHVQAEEGLVPDAIFAEVVHFPEGRVGNILARPNLRSYEIPYLGRASVPVDRQIQVSDLRVAVVDGEIILRSARLGRRVIPRLTCAHNFSMSQGIYRFLCALQAQGMAGDLAWDWGPLRDAPFLPRVVSGRLVVSRASWRVSQDELTSLAQSHGTQRFCAVQHWRAARRLPRWLALAEGDNELPIDLDNVLSVETFIDLVKEHKRATLVELFPGPDQLAAHGPEGRFVHELVVPFVRKDLERQTKGPSAQDGRNNREGERRGVSPPVLAPSTGELPPRRSPTSFSPHRPEVVPSGRRSFPPGSTWLYAKLYTGPATLDLLLRDVVRPVVATVTQTGAADRWFFVRYGDPDWHLRLRFHGQPVRLDDEVLPALQAKAAPFLEDGLLWRIQFDTYEREVERYGGMEGMVLAERLFHADSEAVLALTGLLVADARGDVRWRLAVCGMDLLLSDLGFDLDTRRAIVREARDRFAREFRADANFKHQLGSRFRLERRCLEALLAGDPGADAGLASGLEVLQHRSAQLVPLTAELRTCERAGRLSLPLTELALSYLHMCANRLLRSAHRAHELILYDLLHRLYQSQAARTHRLDRVEELDRVQG